MRQIFARSILLLLFAVIICCVIYPLILWSIGKIFFPFQANGSLLRNSEGQFVGSQLIAQPFTRDEYFKPRPSAAAYDAAASASSALSASNYALRDRVAQSVAALVRYGNGPRVGQLVGTDIDNWFQQDQFQNQPHIVAQWASLHPALAQAWVSAEPAHQDYVKAWIKSHPDITNSAKQPAAVAVIFFKNFSQAYPGAFPVTVNNQVEPMHAGADIQAIFFDMWRQDHPDINLQPVPGDMVTTSASGLDPDISLQNAEYQLDRVAAQWAADLKRNPTDVRREIETLLQKNARAPLAGIVGEKFINVLEINLELNKRYGMGQGYRIKN